MVRILMVNPKADSIPKVPRITTGTAMVGISVARKFCKNRYITRKTSTMASISVCTTELIDRSEEHTSELQSLMRISYAVFCLKKKKNTKTRISNKKEQH